MLSKRIIFAVVLTLLIVLFVGASQVMAGGGDGWWKNELPLPPTPGKNAPSCQTLDNTHAEYVVKCIDDNIVDVQIREIGLHCVAKWNAKTAVLEVPNGRASQSLDPFNANRIRGILYWKVIDADGNFKQGVYRRY